MSENTKIEWADHTFNPWVGCTKVSLACDHCYAEGWAKRSGSVQWGGERRRTSAANWKLPLKWNARAEREGRRFRVFCASLADVFDNQVPADWRLELFELIRATPHLDWLLLTKRIGNAKNMIDVALASTDIGYSVPFAAWPWPNVWIGATVCNQAEADRDIPKLLEVPARVRFLSVEPMLGPIELSNVTKRADAVAQLGKPALGGIDWVICGGEGGPHARPMHPDWARSLRDQCKAAGTQFLFKQWGEHAPNQRSFAEVKASDRKYSFVQFSDSRFYPVAAMDRVGKKAAGRLLDGREHNGFPA